MQAYLLGHTLKRIAEGAGAFTWTVDGGRERFDTMEEAAEWVRNQPRWRAGCRSLHEPRCRGRRMWQRAVAAPRVGAASTRSPGSMRLASR